MEKLTEDQFNELTKIFEKQIKHISRLSAERDLYSMSQAAFRLGIGVETFEREYLIPGKIKGLIKNGRLFIPRSEVERCVRQEEMIVFSGDAESYYAYKKLLKNVE
jgi:hypothetical protein